MSNDYVLFFAILNRITWTGETEDTLKGRYAHSQEDLEALEEFFTYAKPGMFITLNNGNVVLRQWK